VVEDYKRTGGAVLGGYRGGIECNRGCPVLVVKRPKQRREERALTTR